MSAHPQLSAQDAQEMVRYIFSLTDKQREPTALPVQSSLSLKDHPKTDLRGQYTMVASYTDKGDKVVGPLTGTDVVTLRNAKVMSIYTDAQMGFPRFGNNLSPGAHKSYILLKNIDLTGIKQFTYEYGSGDQSGEIEVRIDSQAGPIISKTAYGPTNSFDKLQTLTGKIDKPVSGRHDVYFFAIKREKPNDRILKLTSIQFDE
ncbi:carbohydrate-binding protein [Spirosoma sp. KNUC1025]|uniref:carbohydrate-binding protein n=1 Tax=Spirosoma sp. KNUC1025 TaxID=2894082 RepID=UPI0038702B1A|nr:carbohydrate-binding protein [Spirosoma sp. KNUC1025]